MPKAQGLVHGPSLISTPLMQRVSRRRRRRNRAIELIGQGAFVPSQRGNHRACNVLRYVGRTYESYTARPIGARSGNMDIQCSSLLQANVARSTVHARLRSREPAQMLVLCVVKGCERFVIQ